MSWTEPILRIAPGLRKLREYQLAWLRGDLAAGVTLAAYLVEDFYPKTGVPISGAHPRFLVDHVVERCRFQGIEPRFDLELVHEAVENLLVDGVPPPIERWRSGGSPEGRPAGVRHRAGA